MYVYDQALLEWKKKKKDELRINLIVQENPLLVVLVEESVFFSWIPQNTAKASRLDCKYPTWNDDVLNLSST